MILFHTTIDHRHTIARRGTPFVITDAGRACELRWSYRRCRQHGATAWDVRRLLISAVSAGHFAATYGSDDA